MDMRRNGRADEHDTPYIRLRYSTQFTTGGRTHTIEMEIPVPVGASAEQREQLIREGEAGIEQLYRQIERRGSQRNQSSSEASRPQETARHGSTGYSSQAQTSQPQQLRQPAQSLPSQQVAPQTATRDVSQIISLPEKAEVANASIAARSSIGSEMPVTHNLNDPNSGNIKLREFIQVIRDRWGISPKDAMDLLQVRNLNDMNYRDLLKQLEPLVQKRAETAPKNATSQTRPVPAQAPSTPHAPASTSSTTMRDAGARPVSSSSSQPAPPMEKRNADAINRAPTPAPPSPKPPAPPASSKLDGPANIPVFPLPNNALREVPRSYKFDEEDEEAEEAQSDNNEDQNGMSDALARIKMDELKEIRGTASASQGRLTVLHTLLDSQISDTQFQQIIEGLWNINSDKKLKQDHVEALISWAKEDYFEDEVRAVLAVMNE
jgi:hypothetical protein